jgi:Ni/Fe-hydrogenase subunit HybB-like protein
VASIASVFQKKLYKPLSRLSGLVALALLAGGLMVFSSNKFVFKSKNKPNLI